MATGRIVELWIKRVRRGPMDAAEAAHLVEGRGIAGNANQGGRRQVTVLERERWASAVAAAAGPDAALPTSARRANVVVEGIPLVGARGRVLRLGDCRLRIYGETKPCRLMDETLPGLEAALWPSWGGGAFGEVLTGGTVRVGDVVAWEEGTWA